MHIESPGIYSARGYAIAEVFAIRGKYCLGYVTHAGDTKKATVWLVQDGTKVGGPSDEDLLEFVRPAKPRIKKIQ
jgi:hypothetical protein